MKEAIKNRKQEIKTDDEEFQRLKELREQERMRKFEKLFQESSL